MAEWRPHMATLDMADDDSSALQGRLGTCDTLRQRMTSALGLTRRAGCQRYRYRSGSGRRTRTEAGIRWTR